MFEQFFLYTLGYCTARTKNKICSLYKSRYPRHDNLFPMECGMFLCLIVYSDNPERTPI